MKLLDIVFYICSLDQVYLSFRSSISVVIFLSACSNHLLREVTITIDLSVSPTITIDLSVSFYNSVLV